MLAAVIVDDSGKLTLMDLTIPKPKEGEALVRILGSGVCHSDLHVIKNEVNFPRPAVLGHEVMGQVVKVVDTCRRFPALSEGKFVVSSFIMPCNNCSKCLNGQSNICSVFFKENRLNGNMLDGTKRLSMANGTEISSYSMAGFAEYAVIPLSALAILDSEKATPDWCVLGCAGVTAYSSVSRALKARKTANSALDSAAIIGLGGVGLFMTLFCKLLGVKQIVAIDLDEKKLELAKELGATLTVNSENKDTAEIKSELNLTGIDMVFEAVGSQNTLELALGILNEGGLVTAVGIASHGTKASIEITPLVRREFTLKGSFGGTVQEDLRKVVELAEKGQIPLRKLVTQRYELSEINEAFQSLSQRRTLGRSIIEFNF